MDFEYVYAYVYANSRCNIIISVVSVICNKPEHPMARFEVGRHPEGVDDAELWRDVSGRGTLFLRGAGSVSRD